MILREIVFNNFKSFDNSGASKISDLAKINLIFGNNSSGKSNILKFLNLLFSRKVLRETIEVEGKVKIREISGPFYEGTISGEAYIFHKNVRETPISFDISIEIFRQEILEAGFGEKDIFINKFFKKGQATVVKMKGSITTSGDPYTSTIKLSTVTISEEVIYSDTGKAKSYFEGIEGLIGERQVFENLMGIFNDCAFFLDKDRYLISEGENATPHELLPSTFKNWVHNLSLDAINYRKFEAFVAFIKKYGELDVLKNFNPTFAKEPGNKIELFISNGSERLPIHSFGTGVQQLLLLLAMIFETESRIILIEELELNLSPISQQLLLLILTQLLNDKEIDQVILTSHSEILASTADINTYEVTIEQGISSVKKIEEKPDATGVPDTTFFERDPAIDAQMKKSYIKNPPGDEWE